MQENIDNVRVLTDVQFQNFEDHVKDSTNRMLHNFITMFMFTKEYEKSNNETKQYILKFVEALKEDILKVHTTKATTAFDLTDKQKELLHSDMSAIINNCLAPIYNQIKKE